MVHHENRVLRTKKTSIIVILLQNVDGPAGLHHPAVPPVEVGLLLGLLHLVRHHHGLPGVVELEE